MPVERNTSGRRNELDNRLNKPQADSTTARQTKRPCKGPRESYSGGPGGRANPTRKLRPLSAPTGPRAQRRVGVRAAMPCSANKSVDSAKEAKEAALVAQWLRRRTSETQVPRSNPSQHAYHSISFVVLLGASGVRAEAPFPRRFFGALRCCIIGSHAQNGDSA